MATVGLLKDSAINRIISFINYLRIITRTNYLIPALNTNSAIRIETDRRTIFGGWMEFYNDTYLDGKAKVTCGNANPIRPAGFYEPSNGIDYTRLVTLICPFLSSRLICWPIFAGSENQTLCNGEWILCSMYSFGSVASKHTRLFT